MIKAVSHQPPTVEICVWSQASPCGICDEQSGTGTGLSQYHSTTVRHSLPMFHWCLGTATTNVNFIVYTPLPQHT